MNNLVEIKNNQVVVSSRQVAEHFGKEHAKVLRSIDDILNSLTDSHKPKMALLKQMFDLSTYLDASNRERSEYLMNRDGFSLLVMGFTGKEALQWKMKYIAAFNEMEQELAKPKAPATTPAQENRSKAMFMNAVTKQAKLWLAIGKASKLETYNQICQAKAAETLAGEPVLPLPRVKKVYSATEIGEKLGVSANKIGRLANKYNLKTDKYGELCGDITSSGRQVQNFYYYEEAIEKFQELLNGGVAA